MVRWTLTLSDCVADPASRVLFFDTPVGADCFATLTFEDYDCVNSLPGYERNCGEGGYCNIYARVRVRCSGYSVVGACGTDCSLDPIQYSAGQPGCWNEDYTQACDCPSLIVSIEAAILCGDDPGSPQPAADYQVPTHGACMGGLSQEQCEAAGGTHFASQSCESVDCCETGACCVGGECSVMTEAECQAAAGIWQGGCTSCSGEDGNCAEDTCCLMQAGECSPVFYYMNCLSGYFCAHCESLGGTPGCSSANDQGLSGDPTCAGLPEQVTLTCSGAALVAGADAAYQAIVDACNAAFVVDLDCVSAGSVQQQVTVTVNGNTETWTITASLSFNGGGNGAAVLSMTVAYSPLLGVTYGSGVAYDSGANFFPAAVTCDGATGYRQCAAYATGGYTSSSNNSSPVDFASASITVA